MGKPHNAVLIVTVPGDWKPQRYHNLPPEILSSRYYARGNPIHISLAIAEAYNRERLRPGKWDGTWALMIRTLKTRSPEASYYGHDHGKPKARGKLQLKGGAGI
jgi:hypothetical protein